VAFRVIPCRCFTPGVCAALCLFAWASPASCDTLRITSKPPGASVEMNGVAAGTTPYEKEYPGGYFHRTKTPFGARLEHPLIVRVSLPGYAPQLMAITDGPMNWVDLHRRNHGAYFLVKTMQAKATTARPAQRKPPGAGHMTAQKYQPWCWLVRAVRCAIRATRLMRWRQLPTATAWLLLLPIRTARKFLWMTNSWAMPQPSCDWRRAITELF
jgi:PEGA domain